MKLTLLTEVPYQLMAEAQVGTRPPPRKYSAPVPLLLACTHQPTPRLSAI